MKPKNIAMVAVLLGSVGLVADGCSSSSGCADGGDAACTTSSDGAAQPDVASGADSSDAPALFGFSQGDSCFVVTAVAAGSVDGCGLEVANAAMVDPANQLPITIPFNYDPTTAIVTLGTNGSLGRGVVSNNAGTLARDVAASDTSNAACTWHETDNAVLTLIADNTFTVSVTEDETTFATACTQPPPGGQCTSTWTWTMTRSTTSTPPACQ